MPKRQKNSLFAIIAGSSGFRALENLDGAVRLGQRETPFGSSAPLYQIHTAELSVLFLSRHGERGYDLSAPFVNYRANIWALKDAGVERIIAWSGPGAIDPEMPIGDMLVPDDIIDETRGRATTFFEGLGIGFIRQNPVFCPHIAESLSSVIRDRQGHCRRSDVYVCTQGPRLETRAEIRKFAAYGGTLVGMTLVPEAFLARELEMCYCPVCYVTNYAEGVMDRPFEPGKLFEGLLSDEDRAKVDAAADQLPGIALDALIRLGPDRECRCALAMERYRRRGDIGPDWRTWIK